MVLLLAVVPSISGLLPANNVGYPTALWAGLCDVNGTFGAIPNTLRDPCNVYVDVPSACASIPSCPLVFFFHGTADNTTKFIGPSYFTAAHAYPEVASDAIHADGNMIGIYIQGVSHGLNLGWNIGNTGGNTDDMGFVQAVASNLQSLGHSGRRYAVGISNGASFAHRVATNSGMGFSGIAASIAAMPAVPATGGPGPYIYNYPSIGTNTRKVAVMLMQGSADQLLNVHGTPVPHNPAAAFGEGFAKIPTVQSSGIDSATLWGVVNGCGSPTVTDGMAVTYKYDETAVASISTTATDLQFDCAPQYATKYVEVKCMGHQIPFSINGQSWAAYSLSFLRSVESACATSAACGADAPLYSPSTATTWPAYNGSNFGVTGKAFCKDLFATNIDGEAAPTTANTCSTTCPFQGDSVFASLLAQPPPPSHPPPHQPPPLPPVLSAPALASPAVPPPPSGPQTYQISVTFVLGGTLADYNDETKLLIKSALATAANVSTSAVTLSFSAGSVIVTAVIYVGSQQEADTKAQALREGLLSSPEVLSFGLKTEYAKAGLSAEPTVEAITGAPDSGSLNQTSINILIILGVAVGVVVCVTVVILLYRWKKKRSLSGTSTTSTSTAEVKITTSA